ncbi:hypothetical protein K461DRAFT_283163 [Myriangium duriaei CBS 260.36]|uniref:Amino acid permease/ SLC12A domain-containing protein n=1 Tax=Myriangium duriaei CBS 260.36 TaxID=1168546 RepID=A0A9P4ITK3_9PEZI|nr:hypothetical protein K461DRAFT_283163 [Myriangium duriaei CBS 260.36]
MASMAPTCGGQYHWVSEFAPPSQQKLASYITGWMLFLRWQAGEAGGLFIVGSLIQSLLVVHDSNYAPKGWQALLMIVVVSLAAGALSLKITTGHLVVFNFSMVVHILSCFTTVAILWILAPHTYSGVSLGSFTNRGGWSSTGLTLMVGQVSMVAALGGFDVAVHMAEEVQNANVVVPRIMVNSLLINGVLGVIAAATFAYCVPSIEDAIGDSTGYPFLYTLKLTMSPVGVYVLTFFLMILIMAGDVTFMVATARAAFAFARDQGLPFSDWISKLDRRTRSPNNAIFLSTIISILLSIIYVGSPVAYNAILSVGASGQLASYGLAVTYLIYRRLAAPSSIPHAKWSLGRYGLTINILAAAYSWMVFVWSFFPVAVDPTPQSFNWAPLIFVGTCALATVYYFTVGKKRYKGPVMLTQKTR